jgi:hypothetical protein
VCVLCVCVSVRACFGTRNDGGRDRVAFFFFAINTKFNEYKKINVSLIFFWYLLICMY